MHLIKFWMKCPIFPNVFFRLLSNKHFIYNYLYEKIIWFNLFKLCVVQHRSLNGLRRRYVTSLCSSLWMGCSDREGVMLCLSCGLPATAGERYWCTSIGFHVVGKKKDAGHGAWVLWLYSVQVFSQAIERWWIEIY